MRFRVTGVSAKSGQQVEIDVDAASQKEAFEIAKRQHSVFPKAAATRGGSRWVYKMVQIPPRIEVPEGTRIDDVAAKYLESVVNELSEQGWEFHRLDEVGVQVNPGCLAALFGAPIQQTSYYVVTFRQWVEV